MDEVERGGLSVENQDTITGSTPQGDADFSGITFEIINNSRNPVIVEGQKYQPGEVVKTLVTDSEGTASTSDDLLPSGCLLYTSIPMGGMVRVVVMTVTLLPLGVVAVMGVDGGSLFQYLGHILVFWAHRRKLHFGRPGYGKKAKKG